MTTRSGRSASSSTTNGGPGRSLSTTTARAPASCASIAFAPKLQPPRSTITTARSARRGRLGSRQPLRSSPYDDARTRRVGRPSAAGTRGPIDGTAVKGESSGASVALTRPLTPKTRVVDVAATVIATAEVPGDETEP